MFNVCVCVMHDVCEFVHKAMCSSDICLHIVGFACFHMISNMVRGFCSHPNSNASLAAAASNDYCGLSRVECALNDKDKV